ncbi:MAG: hypothetical protein ABSD97_13750 [Acidimicrobiales bacterium]
MPRRSPDRRSPRDSPARPGTRKNRGVTAGGALGWAGTSDDKFVEDPTGLGVAELRRVQPYQADKTYICPGCNQEIRPGTGHFVVVPLSDATGRRHWHSPCWEHRKRRRPTGR